MAEELKYTIDDLFDSNSTQYNGAIEFGGVPAFQNTFSDGVSPTNIIAGDINEKVQMSDLLFLGAASLSIKVYTDFETAARFSSTIVNGASASFGTSGLNLIASASGTSSIRTRWTVTKGIFDGNPTFSMVLSAGNISDDGTSSEDRQRITDIFNIHAALEAYKTANGDYPTALSALVPTQIATIPKDPRTGGSYRFAYKDDNTDAHIGANLDGASASALLSDEDHNSDIGGWTDGFNGSDPILDFRMESATDPSLPSSSPGTGTAFFGLGKMIVSGSGHTKTTADFPYIGFFFEKTGGVTTLYGIQSPGDGNFTQSEALTTVYDEDILDLIIKVSGRTSVDYYWRKNILGALSLKTTLTTNIPITTKFSDSNFGSYREGNTIQFSSSNNATAQEFDWFLISSSYER